MKKSLTRLLIIASLLFASNANADFEIEDSLMLGLSEAANVATQAATEATQAATEAMSAVETWVKQTAWVQQAKQMMASFNTMSDNVMDATGTVSGVVNRGVDGIPWGKISGLGKEDDEYLPPTYKQILDEGNSILTPLGAEASLYAADVKASSVIPPLTSIADILSAVAGNSKAEVEAIEDATIQQAAINRVLGDEVYKHAGDRTAKLAEYRGRIQQAKDLKDVANLQASIQTEHVLLQNEQIKIAALNLLQQAQSDLYEQRKQFLLKKKLQMSLVGP